MGKQHATQRRFSLTHLMRQWSLVMSPCWLCFQMCRGLQTRGDGDAMSSKAAIKKRKKENHKVNYQSDQAVTTVLVKAFKALLNKAAAALTLLHTSLQSLTPNSIPPMAGLTVNFDWVNLYRHNSHYDPAKCQQCMPCCDGLFGGLLKLWHFLTNDCIIWEEGKACCWMANWFIKKLLRLLFT